MGQGEAGTPRLTVIGTGYLGATHAICMAVLGYEVLGVDMDPEKIDRLAGGRRPVLRAGPARAAHQGAGVAAASGSPPPTRRPRSSATSTSSASGRPQMPDSDAADLTYVDAAVAALAPHLRRRAPRRRQVDRPGRAPPRGSPASSRNWPRRATTWSWPGTPSSCARASPSTTPCTPTGSSSASRPTGRDEQLRAAFRPILDSGTPVVVTDLATAELVKVAANSFLATKISYINAMAEVCEATGADVQRPRRGPRLRRRGSAAGSSSPGSASAAAACPRTSARSRTAPRRSASGRPCRSCARWTRSTGAAAPAPSTSSASCSAAPLHGQADRRAGRRVQAQLRRHPRRARAGRGPHAAPARRRRPRLRPGRARTTPAAPTRSCGTATARSTWPEDADVVVLLTEWAEFREIEPEALGEVVAHRRIVDGRHALDAARWRAAGWEYRALGRN